MSFGFSVSDIYGCARLAYMLYNEFKQAPGACQEFAHELLLFHQVLGKTKSVIEGESSNLNHFDQTTLSACFDSCKELLYMQILGNAVVPKTLEEFYTHDRLSYLDADTSTTITERDKHRFPHGLRHKFRERQFALRIPKLQRAVSAHIEKLTALNVLIIQYVFIAPKFPSLGG